IGDDASAGMAFELASLLCTQGRFDAADDWAAVGRDQLEGCDVMTRVSALAVEARLAAYEGSIADALRMAAAAVMLAGETDAPNIRGQAFTSQGEVLALAGRQSEADRAREEATRLFDAKGNIVAAMQSSRSAAASRESA